MKITTRELKKFDTGSRLEGRDDIVPPILQRVFAARGVASIEDIDLSLQQLLPFADFKGMDKAVDLLVQALDQQQRVLIVGDFDADGATSTAVAVRALKAFGLSEVGYLVPNRFDYGYGLSPELVDEAAKLKPDLIITVDNGISSLAGVEKANVSGMRVLITDHHLPGEALPAAAAIVNPNQPGCRFASKHLAGVGVIFYVMLALRARLRGLNWFEGRSLAVPNMAELLDLVALGTVADVVRLDRNNRVLVEQGLKRLRAGKGSAGINALLQVAGRDVSRLTSSDLGFAVAPRLNAAGRLEDMTIGIACLLEQDAKKALVMAEQLDSLNQERRAIEQKMAAQARGLVEAALSPNPSPRGRGEVPFGLCLYDPSWHQGVVGIVASRIKERVHRPVIAFAKESETLLKGSARSIPGLHLRDALAAVDARHPGLMRKFGGHAMAAGLSLPLEHLPRFQTAFAEEIGRVLDPAALEQQLVTDGSLMADEFTLDTAELLRYAAPWGQGFPEPLFDNVFEVLDQRVVGERHVKFTLAVPESGEIVEAIAFNVDRDCWPNARCGKIRAVYRMDVNTFRGLSKVQLVLEYVVGL